MIILRRMDKLIVDINADLGEGAGQDNKIMPLISSCNIACGGHTGDRYSIKKTMDLATDHNVKIGVHPSYPDTENFGRIHLKISDIDLQESLIKQISLFYEIAEKYNQPVHHIKAHGALYNKIATDPKTAEIYLKAITRLGIQSKLYVPYDSIIYNLARPQFECMVEAFIDRTYNSDLSLVSRNSPDALIKTSKEAWNQLYEIVVLGEVSTINNTKVAIQADTFCIHGDHPNAVSILEYLHAQLKNHNFQLNK